MTNCIVHAYPDSLGKITLKGRILEGGIVEFVIRDWGPRDRGRLPRPNAHVHHRGEERSGMGFTIMESFE